MTGAEHADTGPSDLDPDTELCRLGVALARRITEAVPGWVEREVGRLVDAWIDARGAAQDAGPGEAGRSAVKASAAAAGREAAAAANPALEALLVSDVDAQTVTPLQIVRGLVGFPTDVLAAAGVPPVVRDPFVAERFPNDPYGLTPASLGAIAPALAEPALTWGAAKVMAHRRRHLPPAIH